MRVGRWLLAILLLHPAVSLAQQADADPWSAELRYAHSLDVSGHMRVREFQIRGTNLDLQDDLGVEQWTIYEAELARRFAGGGRIRFSYFYSVFSGSAHRDEPFDYNGASYVGDQDVNIESTTFQRVMFLYEHNFSAPNSSVSWYGLIGLYSDLLNVKVDAELQPDSVSQEKGENYGLQVLIWPTAGFGRRSQLGSSMEWWAEAFGWHVQGQDIPYNEGGEFHSTQSAFDVVIGLRFVDVLLRPGVAFRHRYFFQANTSQEDYNEALLRGNFLELSLLGRF